MFIVACSTPEKNANSKIEIYDDSVLDIIDIYSEIEELADSISLPEGPVWDEASQSLLFVDVMGNKLYKWNENDGTSEYISPSGNTGYAPNVDFGLLGANGLLIDENGDIILCQHGDRRLAKINNSSTNSPSFTTLVDNYEGGRFNSPNDLTYASNGDIYFTDPAFGFFNLETFQFVESELKDLNFNGVYKSRPSNPISISGFSILLIPILASSDSAVNTSKNFMTELVKSSSSGYSKSPRIAKT